MLVCQSRASLEWDKGVVSAGVNHLRAHARFDQCADTLRDVQDQIFLKQPVWTFRPSVVAAVTWVDNDAADLQPQDARQRLRVAEPCWFGRLQSSGCPFFNFCRV